MTREEQVAFVREVAEEFRHYADCAAPVEIDDLIARPGASDALTAAASALEEVERLRAVLRRYSRDADGYCLACPTVAYGASARASLRLHEPDCELARALEGK